MAFLKTLGFTHIRSKKSYPLIPEAVGGARIKVAATGCSHCSAMRDNVKEAVRQMELPEGTLECISDYEEIARLGIMVTPSLIVDGRLVSSGKVLSVERIITVIKDVMASSDKEENKTGDEEK